MGSWGTALYSNDTSSDVRNMYPKLWKNTVFIQLDNLSDVNKANPALRTPIEIE